MELSIKIELTTKFLHTEELSLRKTGYRGFINPYKIDKEVNQREMDIINELICELNGLSRCLLIDCLPIALDKVGHDIMLIDIYNTETDSIEDAKQIIKKYAAQLCDNLKLRFKTYPKTEEFQLTVTQGKN